MYLLSTLEHTIFPCVKILQISYTILVLDWSKWPFWDFLTFYVPLCSKKLSVQCSCKDILCNCVTQGVGVLESEDHSILRGSSRN